MRHLPFVAVLLVYASLGANVIIPRAVERVWFDDADNFFVRFGTQANYINNLANHTCSTNAGTYSFPNNLNPTNTYPFTVNLSAVIPDFAISRAEDHFFFHSGHGEWYDQCINWGPQNDLSVNIHALSTGQSAVQCTEWGNNGGEWYSIDVWVKDSGWDSTDYYYPTARGTLSVDVTNHDNGPMPNVPINLNFSTDINHWDYYTFTDQQGHWQDNYFLAGRTHVIVREPLDNSWAFSGIYYPEPWENVNITAQVWGSAVQDPVQTPPPGILRLAPSVLNRAADSKLRVTYESEQALAGNAELRLYDLRGRLLASHEMPSSGQAEWNLPTLANGIYFIGLSSEGRQLARNRLTVIR